MYAAGATAAAAPHTATTDGAGRQAEQGALLVAAMTMALMDPFFGRGHHSHGHVGGGGTGAPHHHTSNGIPNGHGGGGFAGALAEWSDIVVPRGAASFNVWELSPSKLRTAAVAFTVGTTRHC